MRPAYGAATLWPISTTVIPARGLALGMVGFWLPFD
jgi:hypothetical protein